MCALLILQNRIDRVVIYYNDMVKIRKQIKKNIIMRPETSPDDQSCRFCKEVDEQFYISGDLFSQAIENADGIPYQLIFGQGLGEGYYLNVGYRVKELLASHQEN